MKLKAISMIANADEARQLAIDWQVHASTKSLSYGELAGQHDYFEIVARKFNLTQEFKENGIL